MWRRGDMEADIGRMYRKREGKEGELAGYGGRMLGGDGRGEKWIKEVKRARKGEN